MDATLKVEPIKTYERLLIYSVQHEVITTWITSPSIENISEGKPIMTEYAIQANVHGFSGLPPLLILCLYTANQ